MGPLALFAHDAGIEVCGSDMAEGAIYDELIAAGIEVEIGKQDGEFLKSKLEGLDWFVHTSALPADHPELLAARAAGVKCTKRDDFTAWLVEKLGLKMVAVAGTHGKTTTTSMIVWASLKLGLPVSYVVGTTLGFAASGAYHKGDKYFVYEADEYDRNFLKYHPWLAVITSVSYDHPDIYPTREDYAAAFEQFMGQSEKVIREGEWLGVRDEPGLAGVARRYDAKLAFEAVAKIDDNRVCGDDGLRAFYDPQDGFYQKLAGVLDEFPGVGRRFERISDGFYSDYAHHPEEIAATVDVALDECRLRGYKGVVAVYQPHQNVRQHEVFDGYYDAFNGVSKLYWLPTYLTREDPALSIILPEDFIKSLENSEAAETAEISDELFEELLYWRDAGYMILLMTAGPADGWLRGKLAD